MKMQNKSVYTRRFNALKRALRERFDESVEFSDTASLRWGPECCVVAHDGSLGFTMYFLTESGNVGETVTICKTPYCAKSGLIGIHVRETDLHHILDQIDVALRDGFENIYVESIASLNKEE